MVKLTVRNFRPDDAPAMVALQQKCLAVVRDMDPTPAGFYGHPAFEEGRNIFCALDENSVLRGYAILFNNPMRPLYYMDIKADPELPAPEAAKDLLLARLKDRAAAIASDRRAAGAPEEPLLMYSCYFASATASLAYLKSRGLKRAEALCGYDLAYDLSKPVPACPPPDRLAVRQWALATDDELNACLVDLNGTFPNDQQDTAGLRRNTQIPGFATYAAFDDDRAVGVIMVMPNSRENAYIPYLWVLPQYRRRGIAQALITEALAHAHRLGARRVTLQTGGDNVAAIALYRSAGFEVRDAEVSLAIEL